MMRRLTSRSRHRVFGLVDVLTLDRRGTTCTERTIEPAGDCAPDGAGFRPQDIVLTDSVLERA